MADMADGYVWGSTSAGGQRRWAEGLRRFRRRVQVWHRLNRRRAVLVRRDYALDMLDERSRIDVGLPARLPLENMERVARMFMMR